MKPTALPYHLTIAANCLLLFLALFGGRMHVPLPLQIAGRMHPAALHFPIVLLVLAAIWESAAATRGLQKIGDRLLLAAALSAAAVGLMGLFLSKEGGFDEKSLAFHQWGGVATSLLAWGWFAFRQYFREKKGARRAMVFASLASVVWTGHLGGGLTHGADFLWQPLEKTAPAAAQEPHVAPADAMVFEDLVRPILVEKCQGCHNPKKTKGGLNMETAEGLKMGGDHGPIWDTAATDLGEMFRRIRSPLAEKPHMPPAGKPQLAAAETQLLELWVKNGARFQQKLASFPDGGPLRLLADGFLKKGAAENFAFPAADPATVKNMNNECRSVRPIAAGSPALAVGFSGISTFRVGFLKELSAVKTQVVELNLARMPVGDADLAAIAGFPNLQKLNLSSTKITGATLGGFLKNLKSLQQISLSETGAKLADLQFLGDLPRLERVFLWKTPAAADPAGLEKLRLDFPKTIFENGFDPTGITAKLNAPIIEGGRDVFTASTMVKLKNYIAGAEVRYTLDGSVPDSLTSVLATDDSISIEKTGVLTARAFLPGWLSSDAAARQFYRTGHLPDSAALVFPPNPQYKGMGAATLFDQKTGDTDFKTPRWLAFRERPMEAVLFFRRPILLGSVALSGLVDIGSYIMPATSIEIWGGADKNRLVLLKKLRPEQPKKLGMAVQKMGFTARFAPREVRVLKIVARPVERLPAWHPGKGERAWVFLDEVFLD